LIKSKALQSWKAHDVVMSVESGPVDLGSSLTSAIYSLVTLGLIADLSMAQFSVLHLEIKTEPI
jgi:hypothetical protein